jgi:uncharacterized protein YndB with AHSA1/START domain
VTVMATAQGTASAVIAAPPATVFEAIADIDRLPEWNAIMRSVVERPSELVPGAEWVVEFNALGQTWHSRSVLETLDPVQRRFEYLAGTDDGNPSRARWAWQVDDDPAGSRITVSWDLRPVTFWRRVLFVRIRSRQLARTEVPESLRALAAHVIDQRGPDVAS